MSAGHSELIKLQDALARALDFLCLVGAFAATSSIASLLSGSDLFVWPKPTSSDIAGWPAQYAVLLLSTLIAWNVVSGWLGTNTGERSDASSGHFRRLLCAVPLWLAAAALAIFFFKLREVSRLFVLLYITLASALITLRDLSETIARRRIYRRLGMRRTALIIGNGAQANWLRHFLLDNYCPEPYALVRQIDPADPDYIDGKIATSAGGHRPSSHNTTEVFVAAADVGTDVSALLPRLFEASTEAHIVPGIFDTSIFKLTLGNMGGIPMITLRPGALSGLEAGLKRVFDLAVAAALLTFAAPLIAFLAVLVKVSSPGPVFFRQERVGKGGRRIQIYKFRTMHRNAEHILESDRKLYQTYVENNYKLPKGEDPRITFVGHILRHLSLDEIPQLINVLKGEMSLVGPRPVVPAEIDKYGDYASLLLSVQPGLTGQWQVSGRSDIADYTRRVRLDMEYIRDQSILRDLQILFRTVPVVLSRDGAY
jgi:exopolysaccharide production protein ExoY